MGRTLLCTLRESICFTRRGSGSPVRIRFPALNLAEWQSSYAPDCKSVHPGSILGLASILTGSVAIQCLERNTGSVAVRGSNPQ